MTASDDISRATPLPAGSDLESALVVRLGETEFAVEVSLVREVLRVPRITRLPFPPPHVIGIVGVRGALLPVLDLGRRLLDAPARLDGRLVVVAEPVHGGFVGLLVDDVVELTPVQGELAAPPEVEQSLPRGWIDRVFSPQPDRMVTLLNLTPILELPNPAAEEGR